MFRTPSNCPTVAILLAAAVAGLLPPQDTRAAGIERAVPSMLPLFRGGTYGEANVANVRPRLRGEGAPAVGLDGTTTDLFDDYTRVALALKGNLTRQTSFLLSLDQPWGANTNYGQGSFPPPPAPYGGTVAELNSTALTATLAHDVTPAVKVWGGMRAQRADARAAIPFIADYTIETNKDWGVGYLIGAGYQIPDIALAFALTYHSGIEHAFSTTETSTAPGLETLAGSAGFETPQSVTLEFRTGVADDTLLFGSIRWVDWSKFAIEPPAYVAITNEPLVDYETDWWTYTLGVGRRINDTWAVAVQASYEPQAGATLTTLGPIDGLKTVGGSLTYTSGPLELTGGISYGWIGDTSNAFGTRYEGGTVAAAGLRIGYSF
jgi:long-chain fatty acid transport protein